MLELGVVAVEGEADSLLGELVRLLVGVAHDRPIGRLGDVATQVSSSCS
jgi:hypothetical protein